MASPEPSEGESPTDLSAQPVSRSRRANSASSRLLVFTVGQSEPVKYLISSALEKAADINLAIHFETCDIDSTIVSMCHVGLVIVDSINNLALLAAVYEVCTAVPLVAVTPTRLSAQDKTRVLAAGASITVAAGSTKLAAVIRQMGCLPKNRGGRPKKTGRTVSKWDERLRWHVAQGNNVKVIVKDLGLTPSHVYRLLRGLDD